MKKQYVIFETLCPLQLQSGEARRLPWGKSPSGTLDESV
jgi:hypothetical protein